MAGGKGDEMGEAFHRHRVAIPDVGGDGVVERGDAGHIYVSRAGQGLSRARQSAACPPPSRLSFPTWSVLARPRAPAPALYHEPRHGDTPSFVTLLFFRCSPINNTQKECTQERK